jgi:hypothetical protein
MLGSSIVPGVTCAGLNAQLAAAGNPEHAKLTSFVKLSPLLTWRMYVIASPGATVCVPVVLLMTNGVVPCPFPMTVKIGDGVASVVTAPELAATVM